MFFQIPEGFWFAFWRWREGIVKRHQHLYGNAKDQDYLRWQLAVFSSHHNDLMSLTAESRFAEVSGSILCGAEPTLI